MNSGGMNTTTHTQPAKHPALHPTLERHRGENYTLVECFFFFHEPSVSVWCRVPSRWGAAEVRVTEQKGVRRSLCDRNESRSHRWRTRLFDGGRVWCVCVCVCTVRKEMTREGGQKVKTRDAAECRKRVLPCSFLIVSYSSADFVAVDPEPMTQIYLYHGKQIQSGF